MIGNAGGGPVIIDLSDGDEMPPGQAPYQDDWQPPGETQSFTRPQDFN